VPFAVRCRASGCQSLALLAASSAAGDGVPRVQKDEPPAKKLRLAKLVSGSSEPWGEAWRYTGHLELELEMRLATRSFGKSWTTYVSGWRAWHHFCEAFHETEVPWPVTTARLAAFAMHFRSEGTFGTYMQHILRGQVLLGYPNTMDAAAQRSLVRGIKVTRVLAPKSVLHQGDVRRMCGAAAQRGMVDMARVMAVCYHFTLRAQSEAFPLTSAGPPPLGAVGWRSYVVVDFKKDTYVGASIHLERRKNTCTPSVVRRRCTCKGRCEGARLVCGACALVGALRSERCRRRPSEPLFVLGGAASARDKLNRVARAAGVDDASWHGFRRGSASDLVASGASLSDVLAAGGWRSAAFLRYIAAQAASTRQCLDFSLVNSDSD
jgi:hypothetical protein